MANNVLMMDTPLVEGEIFEPRTEYVNLSLYGDVFGRPHRKPCTDRTRAEAGIKIAVRRTKDGDFEIHVCKHLEQR